MEDSPLLLPHKLSLYVGDLDPQVTEMDLNSVFLSVGVGPISSIRICHCARTGNSLCYGYVNFFTHYEASRALQILNHIYLKGKPMRLMWSQRNPCARKTGVGNLFVKNLDASIDSVRLESMFRKFGVILSCKVVEEHGKSKGFGFVQFDSEDSALAARTALHDSMLEGKKMYVSKFVNKSERTEATHCEEPNHVDLFVKNLDLNMTEDTLQSMFSAFGKVSNVVIMKDNDGKSRGFGFVNFESAEDAGKAVSALNGSKQGSNTLYVARAQKQAKRNQFTQHEHRELVNRHWMTLKASNLYVKNLEKYIDENVLRKLFSRWGQIVSVKVMCYDDGGSKGFGFVCFSNPEEAMRALINLNGSTYGRKQLYVAIAQCKKDRELELQKYFAQSQSQSVYPSHRDAIPPPNNPLYNDFSPRLQPVPYFHNPISYQNCSANANMGSHYLPVAQSFCEFFSFTVKPGKPNLQSKDTSQGCGGMQTFVPKNCWYKVSSPAGNVLRGYPASLLAAAKCSNYSTKRCQQNVQNIQPERTGRSAGMLSEKSKLECHRAVEVVTEANSMTSWSTGETV